MSQLPVQFIKFCLVGAINTVVDFCVYFGLTRGFPFWSRHLVLALVVAFIVATINSYMFNQRWTFPTKRRDHHVMVTKFFLATGSGFIIYTVLFAYLVDRGWYDLAVKIVLIGVVLVWNFVFSKFWVYTKG